ncbi:3-oxoacyl-[acyl-carrier-protein] reductase [Serpentinicella alkaliphila]|uniref:3-oxoacyl-[acyl-carrier-protein] reductase n=1 Tax=Serpentinicella alkaliphila TaxID=1734049 RepID=A0A4R2TPY1_9FIRM|nr:3-oxoacyl-[acyl-carrier-protein] reductase [Serpentinicella alkaliphila]QUH26252.1 3-oxoacyl-[acyl-carrier-protein] reductase [Serpentinicella alkaliphila]TCQ05828.1 3-oxoacyl-[acyl-carrier-protein] reductase [Serpentinicella alkaliphila]
MLVKGKNALVTGASRGIGKEIALTLAKNGANVIVNYPIDSEAEAANEVVKEIEKLNVKALAVKADVTSESEVKEMVDAIDKNFDTLDILVNNAGITRDNLLIRMKEDDWDRVIDVNLKGTFICTKAVARKMMKQKYGKIVNVSSVVGVMGNAGQANYCASKAGVIGLTKSVARELASKEINVNAIAPGFIETEMTAILSEDVKNQMLANIPLKKYGKPEDVANLVLFLSSDLSKYITGQVILVDGGMGI